MILILKHKFSKNFLINVVLAVFVTVLWSSSWLIIKWGLEDIPPLLFSGLRYSLASFLLLALIFSQSNLRSELFNTGYLSFLKYGFYGFVFVTLTQGAQFISLFYLPAISVTLILSLTIIVVLFLSFLLLKERPTRIQHLFILVTFLGIIIYFHDKLAGTGTLNPFGLLIAILGMLANASSFIIGRTINKSQSVSPLFLTGISMTVGSFFLLLFSSLFETFPVLNLQSIIYIVYLAIVNTALAFTIWNKTLQHLRAIDSTLINNLMTPQIVLIALIFLGEIPSLLDWIGISLIIMSVLFIQINQAQRQEPVDK